MALITQEDARLAIPGLTAPDERVSTLIERAESILADWCGYPSATPGASPTFERTTYTRYLHGPGGRVLQLPVWPVVAVTSIEDDSSEEFDGSSYLVASADYDFERPGEAGQVRLKQDSSHGSWSGSSSGATVKPIKAVWEAGYTDEAAGGGVDVPAGLRQAVIEMVAILWTSKDTVGSGGISTADGGAVTTRDPEVPEFIRVKLRPYYLPNAREVVP